MLNYSGLLVNSAKVDKLFLSCVQNIVSDCPSDVCAYLEIVFEVLNCDVIDFVFFEASLSDNKMNKIVLKWSSKDFFFYI